MQEKPPVPSIFDHVPSVRVDEKLIETGDCGIVFKTDGSFRVFSSGVENLSADPETWGEEELARVAIGRRLMALTVALSTPQLMAVIEDAANGLIDMEKLGAVRLN